MLIFDLRTPALAVLVAVAAGGCGVKRSTHEAALHDLDTSKRELALSETKRNDLLGQIEKMEHAAARGRESEDHCRRALQASEAQLAEERRRLNAVSRELASAGAQVTSGSDSSMAAKVEQANGARRRPTAARVAELEAELARMREQLERAKSELAKMIANEQRRHEELQRRLRKLKSGHLK